MGFTTTAFVRMSHSHGCAPNSPTNSPRGLHQRLSHRDRGELAWAPADSVLSAALEVQYVDKLYVNDRNSDAAPAYTVMNARVGLSETTGATKWKGYARLNNLFDRNYAGSVIVGDTNGRFFEPAPGRNWFVGASVELAL
jgi:iron complex outermembrane recepter protein